MKLILSKNIGIGLFLALIIFSAPSENFAKAASGTLFFDVNPTTVKEGQTFVVNVLASSDVAVNAIGAEILYPTDMLEVKNVTDRSVITLYVTKGTISNGLITIEGGIEPAKILKNDSVGEITFYAKKTGQAMIDISEASGLYANDGLGTNVISSRGTFSLNIGGSESEGNVNTNQPVHMVVPIVSNNAEIWWHALLAAAAGGVLSAIMIIFYARIFGKRKK